MASIEKLKLEKVKGKKAYRFLTRNDDEVYIGDPEEKTQFKPQLLLKRWFDECFIKLPIGSIAKQLTFDEENNCLIWEGEWFTVKVYPIDKTEVKATINGEEHVFIQNEHGGLEFEAVLKAKPPVNSFSFPIETKGLKFYYQPPLTEEFKREDCEVWTETHVKTKDGEEFFRPENVVGSYAVYHATRTNIHRTKEDAEKYRVGKAFHIYRPKVVDSAGNEAWCDLNIDEAKGVLTITIPQEFLDKAVYPVTIDPTFGYESVGSTHTSSSSDRILGSWFSCPESGTANSITFYLPGDLYDDGPRKLGIYKKSDNSFVGGTAEYSGETPNNWVTHDLESPQPSLSAEDYWLVHWAEENALRYDSVTGKGGDQAVGYPGSWPDPWNPYITDRKYSIYCTYTAGGGGQTYEINVDAVVKASAEKSLQTTYNIRKDAAVTSQAVKTSEATFNISKDAIAKALTVLGFELGFPVEAVVQASAISDLESTFNISKEAVVQALTTKILETVYNIPKDAIVKSLADLGIETTFNINKDALVQTLADVVVEKVAGQLFEIFKDAVVHAQADFSLESTFNINKDAVTKATAIVNIETIFNVVKDAIVKASATPQVLGVYPINVDAVVKASATPSLQQTLGISKDAVVVAVSTPLIQSTFNISKDAIVKVLAEVSVVKEGEVKVTKLFLMLGNIAIQLTGN